MALQPDVAAIMAAVPELPDIRTLPIAEYRALLNARMAAAPRYDVPLARVDDITIPVRGGDLSARTYVPQGDGPFAAILYFHGGGFVIGNLDISDAICRALCASAGAIVVSLDYRLAPEHPFPSANEDCFDALEWLAANVAAIGGNGLVAVAGDSAGANLSAALALYARDRGLHLAAQALMYPAPDYPDIDLPSFREFADGPVITTEGALFFWSQYLHGDTAPADPQAVPARAQSHAGLAPAFIATAECDPTRDTGERYAQILESAGVPTVARRYAGMPHGFYNMVAHAPSVRAAMDELCDWLRPLLEDGRQIRD